MKYLLLLLGLLGWGLLPGQTVDGYDIRNLDAPYIEIVGVAKFMSNKVTITIGNQNVYHYLLRKVYYAED